MRTKLVKIAIYIIFSTVSLPFSVSAGNVLVPVDSFPPFHIFPTDGGPPYGEVISVIEAVIDRANRKHPLALEIQYTQDLPFARCLSMMKSGKADMIGGVLDKEDRRSYMHLLRYKNNSNKLFLLRRDDAGEIDGTGDLKGETVGTIIGYSYYKAFDHDPEIVKDPVRTLLIALKKLENKRYNIVICSEAEWLSLKKEDPDFASQFRTAAFRHIQDNPVYIGISKKSWLGRPENLRVLKQTIEDMYSKDDFTRIVSDFYYHYNGGAPAGTGG